MNDYFELAQNFFTEKKYQKSLENYLLALKIKPNSIKILISTALNYMVLKKYEEAHLLFEKLIVRNQRIAEIYYNNAICLICINKEEEAIINLKEAVVIRENFYEAYVQLCNLLKKFNQNDIAIEYYKKSLEKVTQQENIYCNLSELYYLNKDLKNAKDCAYNAIKINEKNTIALLNLSICLINEKNFIGAIEYLEKIIGIDRENAQAYNYLGISNKFLGNISKATEFFKKAFEINKNYHEPYYNLAQIELSRNNFKDGWLYYEHRWGIKNDPPTRFNTSKPLWKPEMGFDKKLLIWGEQGLGDELLFSSILKDIENNFDKITVCVDKRLCKLLEGSFKKISFIDREVRVNENIFDYHLPICSLGLFFRKDINSFFNKTLTLNVAAKEFQDKSKKYRCALSWKSINKESGEERSINLSDLIDVLKIHNVEFFDIQYTEEKEELVKFENEFGIKIHTIDGLDKKNDLFGLVQFIKECDFVITVANTNAHLAAASGKTTFLLLPKNNGNWWYWSQYYDGMNIWYPKVIKYSQTNIDDWSEPIEKLSLHIKNNYI